tara:strand:+ start:19 stop:657 length:639 start_codon:yes stop_codon:yes gene_type:complete
MKILNLYACLGGNRYKWGNEHDITAVELDPEAARLYQERFPNDKVIVTDAHQYLLDHYKEFDFIWSSPPCPTHSRIRMSQRTQKFFIPKYPSMILYEEIIFIKHHFKGKYCIENVIPYYEPLISAQKKGRHLYWCNFILPNILSNRKSISLDAKDEVNKWCKFHDYDFRKYKGKQPINKMARNLVDYEAGKTILDTVLGIRKNQNKHQIELF